MFKTRREKFLEKFRPGRDNTGPVNGWENPKPGGPISSQGFGGAEILLSGKTLGHSQSLLFSFFFGENLNFATKRPKREILGKISELCNEKTWEKSEHTFGLQLLPQTPNLHRKMRKNDVYHIGRPTAHFSAGGPHFFPLHGPEPKNEATFIIATLRADSKSALSFCIGANLAAWRAVSRKNVGRGCCRHIKRHVMPKLTALYYCNFSR